MGAQLCCQRNVNRLHCVSPHMSEIDENIMKYEHCPVQDRPLDRPQTCDYSSVNSSMNTEAEDADASSVEQESDSSSERETLHAFPMDQLPDMPLPPPSLERDTCSRRSVNISMKTEAEDAGLSSVEHESDSSSDGETPETLNRQNNNRNKQICDPCFQGRFLKVIAFYMCYVCGKSFCKGCFSGHDNSHGFLSLQSDSEHLEREIDEYLSYLKNESVAERKEKFMKNDVGVCDFVNTKHLFDDDVPSKITGITGYGYKWWVICDDNKSCIKVFSLSSNVLMRYIKFDHEPHDVTEMIVEQKTTVQDSASCRETAISGTDNKPDKKHFLAVSFPWKYLILILDLGKTPAVIHKKVKTEKFCLSIDFYDGKIYIACRELSPARCYSVSIMSPEGVMLKSFQTDTLISYVFSDLNYLPYLSVLNGNIYMTDYRNHGIVCYNDEGRVKHEITIDLSRPIGICVDPSKDKVYTSSWLDEKLYELESDLSCYKPVLDQTTRYMEKPWAMCFYSDKLYVGHSSESDLRSHVTVVRLL